MGKAGQASPNFVAAVLTLMHAQAIRAMRHHLLFYGLAPGAPAASDNTAGPTNTAGAAAAARAEASRVEDILARVLLPACCLVPCVPGLNFELWELLRLLPYVTRYKLYADLKELTEKSPLLTAASKMAVYETRKVIYEACGGTHSYIQEEDTASDCGALGRADALLPALMRLSSGCLVCTCRGQGQLFGLAGWAAAAEGGARHGYCCATATRPLCYCHALLPLLPPRCCRAATAAQVLKRLHNAPDKKERKDACRPHGRLLAKIAAANPVPALETMVQVVSGRLHHHPMSSSYSIL